MTRHGGGCDEIAKALFLEDANRHILERITDDESTVSETYAPATRAR
jgi:hypothetical protein